MSPRDFELRVRLNVKYHSERYGFLVKLVRIEKVILLASTTVAIAFLKHSVDEHIAIAAAGLATFLTIVLIVSGADEACHSHRDFYGRWNMLYQKFLRKGGRDIASEELPELISEMSEISSEEPPSPNTSVMIYSQNLVLRETGSKYRILQRPWRRLLRNFYDGDADNLAPNYIEVETQQVGAVG